MLFRSITQESLTIPQPEGSGPEYQTIKTLVSNATKSMVSGPRILKCWVLGPFETGPLSSKVPRVPDYEEVRFYIRA